MKKRKHDTAQLDLFAWAATRPTAKIISAIPGLAKRMWRERHMQQPNNTPHIVPMLRRA
ncbi:hypothetical protein NKH34_29750 [Mesorhizobium sp. M1148]|uniref:hypothetical protein n=1 Tax=unclassified Mesorhizobium TaxID=325217 RepID=UPI0003CE5EE8|nr:MULTISPECIES: hypothetical protein [unclassified Mesorhizobium]ESY20200.1 hypothetical protein X751_10825 [Mesorhizobium sp. LNJC395A00]WJI76988.1 hypothetical protein NLY37_09950 [Mesorhizobium sp. C395A]